MLDPSDGSMQYFQCHISMTGTAKTEEEEFREIYNIQVYQIPTNRPVIRDDRPDLLYPTLQSKFHAVVQDIKDRYRKGQHVVLSR